MPAIGWMLIHWPGTVDLAGLQRQIGRELALRAACAVAGRRSPHQLPPWLLFLILSLAFFAFSAWLNLR